jgi:glutathione synthase/RimK-type ligase-like ATP-grasp enzyme
MYNDAAFVNELQKRKFEVQYINFHEIALAQHDKIDGHFILDYRGSTLSNTNLIILSQPFFQKNTTPLLTLKIKRIKALPCTIFNNIDSHVLVNDKNYVYQTLKRENIPLPNTESLELDAQTTHISDIVNRLGGYPVVLKYPVSALGLGVYLCNELQEVLNVLNTYKSDPSNLLPLVIQQYVPESKGLTLSVRVVGEIVHARYHLASPRVENYFMAELQSGKHQIACNIDNDLKQLSINTAKALNLDACRIDLFITKEGYQICEVNSLGSFYGMDVTNNLNQAEMLVDLALNKMGDS